jgi:membrane protein YqaA with SNARE-associated domain
MTVASAWVATLAASFLSGFVPLVNIEAWLLGAAALLPGCPPLVVVVPAALGQMAAKAVLFLGGRGLVSLPLRFRDRALAAAARLEVHRRSGPALVFTSALTGLPPFYVVSIAAGVLRFRLGLFLLVGLAGRLLRFGAVFALPRLLAWGIS